MTTCIADCGTDSPDGLLCHACTTRLERDLGDVPAIVADLDVTISRQDRVPIVGGSPRGKQDVSDDPGLAPQKHTRSPVHWGAAQVLDDLTNTLTTWARDVAHPNDQWAAGVGKPALVLLAYIDAIRRHPAAAELVDEITDAIKQARRVVDRPADRVYLGQCYFHDEESDQTCYEEVYANAGASEARCKVCGITHEVAERRAWLLKRAEDMLLTVREAAQMVGEVGHIKVTEAAIRGYLHRKRIAYRPGTTTIRLGDLLAVVVDEGERRTA